MTTLKLLKDYNPNLRFDMIDIKFIKEFEEWMSTKRYHINTIAKHLSHLMIYIKKAISCKYIIDKSETICRRKIQKEPSKHSWLSPDELQKLESYSVKTSLNSKESHVVDAFLFCCYTGLRYSDFIRLSSKNIKSDNNGYWISFISQKTNVYTKLPLSLLFEGKAVLIYEKYQRNMSDLFAIPSNSLVDKILDKVSVTAGIESHISFHTARHTNATLLLYQGISITTVQKLLGHKDLKTTSGYCEILDETIIRELKRKKSAHK